MMDNIYDNTKKNNHFQILYDIAAARMLSQDREIGLCVLFSYDYLMLFRPCLEEYLKSPETFNNKSVSYENLLRKL